MYAVTAPENAGPTTAEPTRSILAALGAAVAIVGGDCCCGIDEATEPAGGDMRPSGTIGDARCSGVLLEVGRGPVGVTRAWVRAAGSRGADVAAVDAVCLDDFV